MSQQVYRATVLGIPRPMGSKRAFVRGGKAVLVDADKSLRSWQGDVRAALQGNGPPTPVNAPVYVRVTFVFPRPLSHYGTGKNAGKLKPTAPLWCAEKPDVDKLLRAVFDCLTGSWIVDDKRIARPVAEKLYTTHGAFGVPQCLIEMSML